MFFLEEEDYFFFWGCTVDLLRFFYFGVEILYCSHHCLLYLFFVCYCVVFF